MTDRPLLQTKPPAPIVAAREESGALQLQREMKQIIQSDQFAELASHALVTVMRKHLGRQTVYIPSPVDRELRDSQIRREFNGTNRVEICKKYKISRARLYQIVGG